MTQESLKPNIYQNQHSQKASHGELLIVYCEDIGENGTCYNVIALHL